MFVLLEVDHFVEWEEIWMLKIPDGLLKEAEIIGMDLEFLFRNLFPHQMDLDNHALLVRLKGDGAKQLIFK